MFDYIFKNTSENMLRKKVVLFICCEGEKLAIDILPVYSQLKPAGEQN